MKKLLFVMSLILVLGVTTAYSATAWRKGTGEDTPLGTEKINDLDDVLFERITSPLDRLLANYVQGAVLTYNSGSTINITAGSVTCSNSAGTVRKMRLNTSVINATFAGNLDTGLEAAATTYYVYASCDADATTFIIKISANSTSPALITSYKRLGSFYNNGSSDIDRTKIYTIPYGNVRADSSGRGLVTDVRDFGTSTSSYTAKTGADVKFAYGKVSVGASSSSTISNLPFSSTSTFRCNCNFDGTTAVLEHCSAYPASGSTVTIYNGQASGRNINWSCMGY